MLLLAREDSLFLEASSSTSDLLASLHPNPTKLKRARPWKTWTELPQSSKQRISSLPHSGQEESALQPNETDEGPISK